MAIQDRTGEFRSAVSSQLRILGAPAARKSSPNAKSTKSQLMSRASAIANEITETTEMLQRLSQLAKRRAMFDDRPQEIMELTEVMKQKVSSIKEAIRSLEPLAASAASDQGAWASRARREQAEQHSRNVVVTLQGRLQTITGQFAQVLENRSRNLQESRSRTDKFLAPAAVSAATAGDPANPLYARTPSPITAAIKTDPEAVRTGSNGNGYGENPYAGFSAATLPPSSAVDDDVLMIPQQQEQATVLLEDQQASYLSQRSTAVDAIESTINELGSMFSQLSTMIAEQRETVQRIDANTDDITLQVNGAHRELLKYYARVSSNRGLMLKSFGVILVFFFLWVLIS